VRGSDFIHSNKLLTDVRWGEEGRGGSVEELGGFIWDWAWIRMWRGEGSRAVRLG